MKTKRVWLFALLLLSVAACKYDDGEIWDKVNSLDNRVSSIEEQLKKVNSEISALQTITNALQNHVYVASVETTENGCTITFSNGEVCTITNGADGKDAPVITIAKDTEDNRFYWMQIDPDGNKFWLLDPDTGDKIPVTGKDAIAPQLKVDALGFWLISYDGGVSFTAMKDEKGNPIKAVGKDGANGDSFFNSVKVEGDLLIIVLTDGTEFELPISTNGIPSDRKAQPNPKVSAEEINTNIPNFSSPILEDGTNGKVARISLTGIQTPNNDWLKLYGTDDARQNVWMEIDGVPKSIAIVNSEEAKTRSVVAETKAQADVVFLVDNSGSMGEEANAVAREILSWAGKLAQVMDVKFGCVGYEDYGAVTGALNITDISDLDAYLNRPSYYGTNRTKGYAGNDAENLEKATSQYITSGECGAMALRFADEQFAFRSGANRIYVNLTDEPNQPQYQARFSVESVNPQSEYYEWNTAKGTIHTVFSGANYGYTESYNWSLLREEKPWLMSEYTGGTAILDAPSDFSGVTLDSLPVTGAITNSYIVRFNVTPDLLTGKHTVKITIISEDGAVKAEKVFEDVEFVAA